MINSNEIKYLRELAKQYNETCFTQKNTKKRQRWYDINDLKPGAIPVFCNHYWPLAFDEIFPKNTYKCENEDALWYEKYFKTRLFYANQLDDDNVMEPVVHVPMNFWLEDYEGMTRKIKRTKEDTHNSGAYEIIPIINQKEDINIISNPILHYDRNKSLLKFQQAQDIFEPILTVIKKPHTMAAKIADEYSWLRGMENTYTDMLDNPEWMHDALKKITSNFIKRFKTLEDVGIWGTLDNSEPLGSAGLRYMTGIPDFRDVKDCFNHKVKLSDSWGFTCAEVFNCVSNAMHNEFSFEYDKEVMNLFKVINVGCCEVLDKKVSLISSLPNTRKLSISEWCDPELAAKNIKDKYVFSYRAAGVHFVNDQWDKENAKKEIQGVLKATKKYGCNTEIVLNIGGTLGKHPIKKVVEWSKMVRELINLEYNT